MAVRYLAQRRVVVTGLGLLTPVGANVEGSWNAVCSGQSGVRALTAQDHPDFPKLGTPAIGAMIAEGFQKDHWMQMIPYTKNLFNAYATCAATEALANAGWVPEEETDQVRTGIVLGTGLGSVACAIENQQRIDAKGYAHMDRLGVLKVLQNLAAGGISLQFRLKGPTNTVSTACASGQSAIGEAFHYIQRGDADVMIAVAAEHSVMPFVLAGFSKIGALSRETAEPEKASCPFDAGRSGFVIGEGAGALILEDLEHALKREARIYAEIRGYGCCSEGEHLTKPRADGEGAYRVMMNALRQGGLSPEHVGMVNAHATSTEDGDLAEATAIARVFQGLKPVITANKGNFGHLMGAAGVVEAAFTALSISTGVIPPILNLKKPVADLAFATHLVRKPIEAALSNSFGFGGINTSLLFSKYTPSS